MKIKAILILAIISILGCKNNPPDRFIISGELKGDSPKYIYLHIGNKLDSSLVHKGKFSFMGKVDFPVLGSLSIPPISTIQDPFYIENSTIVLNLEVENKTFKERQVNFIKVTSLLGTKTKPIQDDFEKFTREHMEDRDWITKLYEKLEVIIEENPNNGYSGDLLAKIAKDSILSLDQLDVLFKKLDRERQSKHSLMSIKKILEPYSNMEVGNTMIDFSLPDQYNSLTDTKIFRGNILLIDFWASWCLPCRKQNKDLSKIYTKYKDKGFSVLGVSIDTDNEKWKAAIHKDSLAWVNVIDKDGFDGEVPAMYNISSSIPHNFLMDEDGKIIAEDIPMLDLENQLIKLLN